MTVFNAGLPQVSSNAAIPIGGSILLPATGTITKLGSQEFLLAGYAVAASGYPDAAQIASLKISNITTHNGTGVGTRQMATDGNGVFVAARNNSNSLTVSTDGGATWTDLSVTAFGSTSAQGVAYGNGRFMAVGSATGGVVMAYSTNGTTWTTGASVTVGGSAADASIAFGNGLFVVVCGNTATNGVFTTTDGTSISSATGWSTSSSPQVAWNGSAFLIVDTSATFWRSTNGTSWTSFTAPAARWSVNVPTVAGANGVFVYLDGSSGQISTDNGVTWSVPISRPMGDLSFGIYTGSNEFVLPTTSSAMGDGFSLALSRDFTLWRSVRFPSRYNSYNIAGLCYDGTRFVCLNNSVAGRYSTNVNQAAFVGAHLSSAPSIGSGADLARLYVRIK